jgi:hypothetical protein
MSRKLIVLILLMLVPVSGCGASSDTEPLPTIMDFPTLEPSATPDESATEEVAALPTTAVPTDTEEATLTLTATLPLATATPGITSTPSNTPRPRATATFSLTPPPTATETPLVSATPDSPRIISFQASSSIAVGGGQVTLTWEAVGDNPARVERLNQNGQVVQTFSVTPSGSLPVTIPVNEGATVTYRLAVSRAGQEVTSTLTITIGGVTGTATGAVNCATPWFFGNEIAPANAGCPTGPATQVSAAYQPFQTGRMFFFQNTIYALVDPNNGTQGDMTQTTNGWDNQTTYASYNCAGTPPSGTVEPQQMFAWVFCQTLGPGGPWSNTIGFATSSIDTSQRTIQIDASGAIYVDTPAGNVYRLPPVPVGQLTTQWTKIK